MREMGYKMRRTTGTDYDQEQDNCELMIKPSMDLSVATRSE
jgi:hypothetical protein